MRNKAWILWAVLFLVALWWLATAGCKGPDKTRMMRQAWEEVRNG